MSNCGNKVHGKQIDCESLLEELATCVITDEQCCTSVFDLCITPFTPYTKFSMGEICCPKIVIKDHIEVGILPFKCYRQKLDMGTL